MCYAQNEACWQALHCGWPEGSLWWQDKSFQLIFGSVDWGRRRPLGKKLYGVWLAVQAFTLYRGLR